jgi:SP family general alpha glucoside:H+ symporter-like MFS transporter
LGLFGCGIIYERYGHQRTMFGALVMVIGFIFVLFFARNVEMLLAGEALCGVS